MNGEEWGAGIFSPRMDKRRVAVHFHRRRYFCASSESFCVCMRVCVRMWSRFSLANTRDRICTSCAFKPHQFNMYLEALVRIDHILYTTSVTILRGLILDTTCTQQNTHIQNCIFHIIRVYHALNEEAAHMRWRVSLDDNNDDDDSTRLTSAQNVSLRSLCNCTFVLVCPSETTHLNCLAMFLCVYAHNNTYILCACWFRRFGFARLCEGVARASRNVLHYVPSFGVRRDCLTWLRDYPAPAGRSTLQYYVRQLYASAQYNNGRCCCCCIKLCTIWTKLSDNAPDKCNNYVYMWIVSIILITDAPRYFNRHN